MNTAAATATRSPYFQDMGSIGIFLGREIGRCRSCKTVIKRDSQFWSGSKTTCACGARVQLKGMWGSKTETECGPRCTGAVGPACDCKCGGENHGGGH